MLPQVYTKGPQKLVERDHWHYSVSAQLVIGTDNWRLRWSVVGCAYGSSRGAAERRRQFRTKQGVRSVYSVRTSTVATTPTQCNVADRETCPGADTGIQQWRHARNRALEAFYEKGHRCDSLGPYWCCMQKAWTGVAGDFCKYGPQKTARDRTRNVGFINKHESMRSASVHVRVRRC